MLEMSAQFNQKDEKMKRLRNLLTSVGVLAAIGAFSLTPTVVHASDPGPIAKIVIGSDGSDTVHVMDADLLSASVTLPVYGVPAMLSCYSGTAGGSINGGTTGIPNHAVLSFSTVNLNCDSFYPGTTVTMTLDNCNVEFVADIQSVSSNKTDLVVGRTYLSSRMAPHIQCLRIDRTGGCTLRIGGSVASTIEETEKTRGGTTYNELTLNGSGLTTNNPNLLCLGEVGNGTAFSIDASFDVGPSINFVP